MNDTTRTAGARFSSLSTAARSLGGLLSRSLTRSLTRWLSCVPACALLAAPGAGNAQDEPGRGESGAELRIEEIVVTSRRREESLQDVPDSVTVFTARAIEDAGIDDVADFVELTPNITLREAFRAGVTFITIRGITTGQQGWAPVTYVVDGVPAGSLDAINQGALVEIERIEVLKGPQSALYGAGAIAGAINVITKQPADELEVGAELSLAKNEDYRTTISVSGPIVEDRVKFRLDGYYRDADGIIETNRGEGLDFEEHAALRGRLLFDLDAVSVDLRAHFSNIEAGAAFQEFLPPGAAGFALLDDFDASPGIERGIVGVEDRRFAEGSVKIDWNFGPATFTSITGYSEIDQSLFGSTSWQRPPAFGFCGPVGGPGEPPDCFQRLGDDFEVFTQDLRLTSDGAARLRWLAGVSFLDREVVNLLRVGAAALDGSGNVVEGPAPFLNRIDERNDEFVGIYGQINYDLTPSLELTVAARYDRNDFDSTQFESLALATPVPQPDGSLVLEERDDLFQPKVQLSYDWNEDVMTYASIARGFRTGFFNTGNLTQEETTWNYELGAKSTLAGGRAVINAAVFYIDYSNQQFTRIVPPPQIRETDNIPETDILGLELEGTIRPVDNLDLGFGLGVTDAEVADGTDAPFTPLYTLNLSAQYSFLVGPQYDGMLRVDYRRQDSQFLERGEIFEIGEKDYVNARVSLGNDTWTVTAFGDNLTDERQANEINNIGFGFIRVPNKPRSYGLELALRF